MFVGVQDAHRHHESPDNLLKPFRVAMEGTRARQRWEIPSLKLAFTVTMAGGSRTDCGSWFIVLEPLAKTSSMLTFTPGPFLSPPTRSSQAGSLRPSAR